MQLRPRRVALGCWPDARQTLLIGAGVWEGQRALDAWNRWREAARLEDVTGVDAPLLAAAYRPLRRLGVDDPMLTRARGVYRRTWYMNQFTLRRAASVVAALQAAGIEVVVLKGVAITLLYNLDVGSRPMEDIDLLLPPDRLDDAVDTLGRHGWHPLASQAGYGGPLRYGTHVEDAESNEVDLHRYALMQSVDDSDLWETRVALELNGTRTWALAPAEQLLHVCAHGMRWDGSTIRWAVDAMSILRAAGDELDWDRFVERVRSRRITVAVGSALAWLQSSLDAEVPDPVLRALQAGPRLRFERLFHRVESRPSTRLGFALMSFDRYRRFAQLGPAETRPRSFAQYLGEAWGLERPRELVIHGTRKLAGHALR